MSGTFQGVGTLQFSPDNKFCSAQSGVITVNNVETNLLEFSNNSEYLILHINPFYTQYNSDVILFKIHINDIVVYSSFFTANATSLNSSEILTLYVPPFTTIKITGQNTTDANSRDIGVSVFGEVKGAIEQFNLEVKNE
jgi:hypothetical protein